MIKECKLEKDIRSRIGKEMLQRFSLEGEASYNGELDLKAYRKFFPTSDDVASTYLSLKKINSNLAKIMAYLYEFNESKEINITEKKYPKAAEYRDKEKNLNEKIINILKKLEAPSDVKTSE